jgi:hypothetical protein
VNTRDKIDLLRLRDPLNPSADDDAIERYQTAVIEGADLAALEDLACATLCTEVISRLRHHGGVDRTRLKDLLDVIAVMDG